jgi:hypothetical protein
VLPQPVALPQEVPRPRPASGDLPERLRRLAGGPVEATELLDLVRRELAREYERGYHDGWASTKRPARSHPSEDRLSRRRRRMRRTVRRWASIGIVRLVGKLLLMAAVSLLAAVLGMHLTNTLHDPRFEPPPANPK